MMQMDLESKRLDLEAKRSKVQTEIDLNKVRQQQLLTLSKIWSNFTVFRTSLSKA